MRITQLLTFNGFQRKLQNNRQELAKFQEQVATGQRVVRPSDDNVAFGSSRQLEATIRKNEQYQSNIRTGLTHARSTQEALDSMIDVLIDFKSTTVNGATDSLNAGDRESLADEVAGFKDKIMDFGNSQFSGIYLFGGTKSANAPFSEDATATGGVKDTSTSNPLKARISDSTVIETTITGNELRDTAAGDLFEVMKTVEDALRANDRQAVSNALGDVDKTIDHVTGLASKVGININRMDFVSEQIESRDMEMEGEISRLVDADYAEAMTNFKKHELSYQAALSVHSRISQMTLLNYM